MNKNAFYKTMAAITDENLDMNSWAKSETKPGAEFSCGTTMCLAGHAVKAAGHDLRWVYDEDEGGWFASVTTDGASVEILGQEILDLSDDEANELFFEIEVDTVDELWKAVTRVAGLERPVDVSV